MPCGRCAGPTADRVKLGAKAGTAVPSPSIPGGGGVVGIRESHDGASHFPMALSGPTVAWGELKSKRQLSCPSGLGSKRTRCPV